MRIELDAEAIQVRTRLPAPQWELRLRDRRGNPVPHFTLVECIRIAGCGANDGPLGKSDGAGRLRVIVQPQEIGRLALEAESGGRLPVFMLRPEFMGDPPHRDHSKWMRRVLSSNSI